MKNRRTFVAPLTLSLALMAGASFASDVRKPTAASGTTTRPDDAAVAAKVDSLLARMTPEEKAGQLTDLFVFQQYPTMKKAAEDAVAAGRVGALLFVTDPVEINRLQRIAMERSRLKIPLLFGFDVVHGLRTIFPVPIANAASWDPEGVERAQTVAAREARAVGIHWTFAPMVDITRDARWGRIVEGGGEDTYLGSAMAAAQVRGFQGPYLGAPGHVIAGPKHFVGYGAATGGRDYEEVDLSDEALWNIYLPPFKAAIGAGAGNIMSAYMPVNGVPATGNRWLLTDVLRKHWGFKGFVVSDAGAVENLRTHGYAVDHADAAVRALEAGVDMEMTATSPKMEAIPAAIAAGRISQGQLDQAVRRILEAKFRMGLFNDPYVDEKAARRVLNDRRSLAEAQRAAERAAVLLKNDGDVLPLSRERTRSLAVIGPLAASGADALGSWTFKQNDPIAQSLVDGIKAAAGPRTRVTYVEGVSIPRRRFSSPFDNLMLSPTTPPGSTYTPPGDETAGIAGAVKAAKAADVAVVVVGDRQDMTGEAASSSSFDLTGRQQELLDAVVATGKPVVVVLMSGRPIDLKDTKAAAILDIWHPGSAAGSATASLLFGDAVPGGKLPFTWPRNAAQSPMFYNHLTTHEPNLIRRRYWNESSLPTYPFGHGLSYSTFAYANLQIDRLKLRRGDSATVSVDVMNTGKRRADEVAQLYIHQRFGTQARPVRELKGFQRVSLAPGETRTLRFRLSPAELRYWNAAKRDWVIDTATFDYAVGGSSAIRFGATFETTDG